MIFIRKYLVAKRPECSDAPGARPLPPGARGPALSPALAPQRAHGDGGAVRPSDERKNDH